jgi:hypothetical protein
MFQLEGRLYLYRSWRRGQETGQSESPPLFESEGRAFVVTRRFEEPSSTKIRLGLDIV